MGLFSRKRSPDDELTDDQLGGVISDYAGKSAQELADGVMRQIDRFPVPDREIRGILSVVVIADLVSYAVSHVYRPDGGEPQSQFDTMAALRGMVVGSIAEDGTPGPYVLKARESLAARLAQDRS
jgi:hypothetical protein